MVQGILIEPRPSSYTDLRLNRPNTASINAAICNSSTVVHYVEKPGAGGIVERMTDKQKGQHFPDLDSLEKFALSCIPMQDIFDQLLLTHINFFSLSVEGAELSALRTIDFDKMGFDIIVIEFDGTDVEKEADITALLASVGYHAIHQRGIDMWYARELFTPSINHAAQVSNVAAIARIGHSWRLNGADVTFPPFAKMHRSNLKSSGGRERQAD